MIQRRVVVRSLFLVLAAMIGCAQQIAQPLGIRPVPLIVPERMPLRAAVLVAEEELQRIELPSFTTARGHTPHLRLRPMEHLEEVLVVSFPQIFERVTVVRTLPPQGSYQVVLVPKIEGMQWASSIGIMDHVLRFTLRGNLRILDESGDELAAYTEESQSSGKVGALNINDTAARVVSEAIGQMVRKWGERLSTAPVVKRYTARFHPASPGGALIPGSSEIRISFSHPADTSRVADEMITVFGLVSASKGVQRLDLTVNGRPVPVSRDVRVQPTHVQDHPFTAEVPLRPGQNLIAVTAVDPAGQAAQAVRTVYREVTGSSVAAPARTRERWAVVIGIDQYRDPAISSLRYATADAEAIFQFFTTKGGVKPANVRLLLDKDATQRNIRQVLGDFLRQKALTDDEVIIYYAGHGTTEPDQSAEGGLVKYLVPWDADPQSLFSTAIPMEEVDRIFGRLSARKILMIQDTCFSGGAGGRTFLAKGLTTRSATLTDKFLQELTQKEGRMILTASELK